MAVYLADNPEWLREAIKSVLENTTAPNEVIIVIDGPIGSGLERVISHYGSLALVSVIRLEKNFGLGYALNVGIQNSSNELIARMDSDDISVVNRFEIQLNAFKNDKDLEILGGQISEFVGEVHNATSRRIVPLSLEEIKRFSKRRSPFNHPTVMYKKSSIERLGGYDSSVVRLEDYDLWLRALAGNVNCRNLEQTLLYYRTSNDAIKRRKTIKSLRNHIKARFGFYSKRYISLPDLLYGIFTQLILFVIPVSVAAFLFKRLARG
ncbi:hypothetical protein B7Y92_00430 [Candidatus Saccharibacteria bacterium 32-50-13]|nr:MAG: hypothetical protein B7Y92_00430 [Candidatus Saccharibacteria bacterium 32-50-13]